MVCHMTSLGGIIAEIKVANLEFDGHCVIDKICALIDK